MLCCRHRAAARSPNNHLELHPCESTGVEARADGVWHLMPLLIFVVAKAIIHGPLGPGQHASSLGSPASLFGLSPTFDCRHASGQDSSIGAYGPSTLYDSLVDRHTPAFPGPGAWCPSEWGKFATSQSPVLPWHVCMQHIMTGQGLSRVMVWGHRAAAI